jgi:Holliday junction resolvase RusA-like endonuclease
VTGPLLLLDVDGVPVPQGSKRAFRHSKTGNVVMIDDNPALAAWRYLLAARARQGWGNFAAHSGPVAAELRFYLPRPRGHYGTGRNMGTVKASAPALPGVKPDLDKLARAVFDALTVAGVWSDDAVCVDLVTRKRYADGRPPGVFVILEEVGKL